MPRNSSGVYSLPAGNPVVSDTVIETNWANPTLADIAQALSDSLDRNGRGGMLAPMKFADGTVAAPSIAWANETSTGFYRPASKTIGASVNGVEVARFTDTMNLSVARFGFAPGTAAAPGIFFNDATQNTGLFSPAQDSLGFCTSGAQRMNMSSNMTGLFTDFTVSKVTPTLIINKTASGQSSNIAFKTAGVDRWFITGSNATPEGGNAGSDFSIGSTADNGTGIGTKLLMERKAGGAIRFGAGVEAEALSLLPPAAPSKTTGLDLLLKSNTASVSLLLDAVKDAANSATIGFYKAGTRRWSVMCSNAAETGGNAGSNFAIIRNDDAGAQIDVPLSISRATGIVAIKTSLADLLLTDSGGNPTGTLAELIEALTVRVTNLEGAI